MLHSSVHIQIFTERNSINVSLSRVGLHECHGKQHINTAVGLDSPRNGADNILTLAGDDRAGYLLKPVRMVSPAPTPIKGLKFFFLPKFITSLPDSLSCPFCFFGNLFG